MTTENPVVVVGGGLGGLASGLLLAAAGKPVRILERTSGWGGKCGVARWEGFHWDTGPSLLTMPEVVRDLFRATGVDARDYLEMEAVEPGCRYHFADGSTFDAPGKVEDLREAVAREFPRESRGLERFLRYAANLWEVSGPVFLYHPLRWRTFLKISPGALFRGVDALRPGSLHRVLTGFFKDPRLLQLFSRFATYNGSDPYRTPGTFNVIAHVEFAFGSWRIRGGMFALVEAMLRRAGELGVELRAEAPVARIRFWEGTATGVELEDGSFIDAPAVVINADAVQARTGPLLAGHPKGPRPGLEKREASSSGFVLLLAVDDPGERLAAHNIVFPENYRTEFEDLFHHPRPLTDPTLYLSVPAAVEPGLAPEGKKAWFVLVNAPSLQQFDQWDEEAYGRFLIERLQSSPFALDPAKVLWREARSPRYFHDHYRAWHGSLYGPSSNTLLAAFLRQKNDPGIPGVYFAGGSAHPGGGIPLVLLSARHATAALLSRFPAG
jgi:phytoene desaturase